MNFLDPCHAEHLPAKEILKLRHLPSFRGPAHSRTTLERPQDFPLRLANARGLGGTAAACGKFRHKPMRNVLWFDLLWQAIPDLLDEIEAIDTQRIDANGYEGSPGWTGNQQTRLPPG